MSRPTDFLYIAATIALTAYGQLVLKWRLGFHGALPAEMPDKVVFLLRLLLDPFIFSGFFSAFLASLTWMAALTKFELGLAYPFMSLSFVVVTVCAVFLLHESFSPQRLAGVALIVVGTAFVARA